MSFLMNRSAIQAQHNTFSKSRFYQVSDKNTLTVPNFRNDQLQQQTTNLYPNHTISEQFQNIDLKDFQIKKQLVSGINHPRIRQMILSHEAPQQLIKSKNINLRKTQFKNNLTNLQLLDERKWLTKKGKKYLINFDDQERKEMKQCFNALDQKKLGSIGIDQLQELLLSVGLAQTREQVKKLVDSVDQDRSGKIQFSQFITMILNDDGQNQNIVNFFKNIINQKKNQKKQQIPQNKSTLRKSATHSKAISIRNIDEAQSFYLNNKQNYFQNFKVNNQMSKLSKYKNKNIISQNAKQKNNSVLNVLDKYPHPKNLPFGMVISHIRRKHMMTALQIANVDSKKMSSQRLTSSNKSSTGLRSSQNNKQFLNSSSRGKTIVFHKQQDIEKGQSVMKALRKMWDRRLLRKIRQSKNSGEHIKSLTQSGKLKANLQNSGTESKSHFPNLRS